MEVDAVGSSDLVRERFDHVGGSQGGGKVGNDKKSAKIDGVRPATEFSLVSSGRQTKRGKGQDRKQTNETTYKVKISGHSEFCVDSSGSKIEGEQSESDESEVIVIDLCERNQIEGRKASVKPLEVKSSAVVCKKCPDPGCSRLASIDDIKSKQAADKQVGERNIAAVDFGKADSQRKHAAEIKGKQGEANRSVAVGKLNSGIGCNSDNKVELGTNDAAVGNKFVIESSDHIQQTGGNQSEVKIVAAYGKQFKTRIPAAVNDACASPECNDGINISQMDLGDITSKQTHAEADLIQNERVEADIRIRTKYNDCQSPARATMDRGVYNRICQRLGMKNVRDNQGQRKDPPEQLLKDLPTPPSSIDDDAKPPPPAQTMNPPEDDIVKPTAAVALNLLSAAPHMPTKQNPSPTTNTAAITLPPGIALEPRSKFINKGRVCQVVGCEKLDQRNSNGLCRAHHNLIYVEHFRQRDNEPSTCPCGGKITGKNKKRCGSCFRWKGGVCGPHHPGNKAITAKKTRTNASGEALQTEYWKCQCGNEVEESKQRCGNCYHWRGGKRLGGWKLGEKPQATNYYVEDGIDRSTDWECCGEVILAKKTRCGKCKGWRGGKRRIRLTCATTSSAADGDVGRDTGEDKGADVAPTELATWFEYRKCVNSSDKESVQCSTEIACVSSSKVAAADEKNFKSKSPAEVDEANSDPECGGIKPIEDVQCEANNPAAVCNTHSGLKYNFDIMGNRTNSETNSSRTELATWFEYMNNVKLNSNSNASVQCSAETENLAALSSKMEEDKQPITRTLSGALLYLDQVKTELIDHPNVYRQFMDILNKHGQGKTDDAKTINRVKVLLKGHDNLISGFEVFANKNKMKNGCDALVTWEGAHIFFDQVKTEFADHPDTFSEFIDILQKFKDGRLDSTETTNRVKVLLKGNDNLISRFYDLMGADKFFASTSSTAAAAAAAAASNAHPVLEQPPLAEFNNLESEIIDHDQINKTDKKEHDQPEVKRTSSRSRKIRIIPRKHIPGEQFKWTEEEDHIISTAVTRHLRENGEFPLEALWGELAELFGTTTKRVSNRWFNHLHPKLNYGPFSRGEDLRLWKGHGELGGLPRKWKKISEQYFNSARTAESLRKRWGSEAFKKTIETEFGPSAFANVESVSAKPKLEDKPKIKKRAKEQKRKQAKEKSGSPRNITTPKLIPFEILADKEDGEVVESPSSSTKSHVGPVQEMCEGTHVTASKQKTYDEQSPKKRKMPRAKKNSNPPSKKKRVCTPELVPFMKQKKWTPDEDRIISEAATRYYSRKKKGVKSKKEVLWSKLATQFGVKCKRVRDRWINHLDPKIDHSPFSREDDLRLWEGRQELGKEWHQISVHYFDSRKPAEILRHRWIRDAFKKTIETEFGPNAFTNENLIEDKLIPVKVAKKSQRSKKRAQISTRSSPIDRLGIDILYRIVSFLPSLTTMVSFCLTSKQAYLLLKHELLAEKLFRRLWERQHQVNDESVEHFMRLGWKDRFVSVYNFKKAFDCEDSKLTESCIIWPSPVGVLQPPDYEGSAIFYDNSHLESRSIDSSQGYFGLHILHHLPQPPNTRDWQSPLILHGDFNGVRIFRSVDDLISLTCSSGRDRFLSLGDTLDGGQVLSFIQCHPDIWFERGNEVETPPCCFVGFASGRVAAIHASLTEDGTDYTYSLGGGWHAHNSEVSCLAIVDCSSNENESRPVLFSACCGGKVYYYPNYTHVDTNSQAELAFSNIKNSPIFSMAPALFKVGNESFSVLCTGDQSGMIRLWSVNVAENRFDCVDVGKGGQGSHPVTVAKVIQGNDVLVTGNTNGDLQFWNLKFKPASETNIFHPRLKLKEDKQCVHSGALELCMIVGNVLLTSGGNDGEIIGWDTNTGDKIGGISCHPGKQVKIPGRGSKHTRVKSCVVGAILPASTKGKMISLCRDGVLGHWTFSEDFDSSELEGLF